MSVDAVLSPVALAAQTESSEPEYAKPEHTEPADPHLSQSPASYQTIVTTGDDTLNSLSEKCCGDIRCAPLLKKLNPNLPDNPLRPLQKGLVLLLPTFEEVDDFKKQVLGADVS